MADIMNPMGVPLWIWLVVSLFMIIVAPKLPLGRTGKSAVAVIGVGVLLLPLGSVLYPQVTTFFQYEDEAGHLWTIRPIAELDGTNWPDAVYTDTNVADATEIFCNEIDHKCTILVTATRVAGGISNTAAPAEFMLHFYVKRQDDDPNIPNNEDYATLFGSVYNLPSWTNTSNDYTIDTIAKNAYSQPYVWWEDKSNNAELYSIGTQHNLGMFQPGESDATIRLGFVLNQPAFGLDGQTAGVSYQTIGGMIGGYSITFVLETTAVS